MDKMKSTHIIDLSLAVIGALILISALTKIQLFFDLLQFQYFWEKSIVIIYFLSAVIAFIGLIRVRPWGFIAAYAYILIATFFLSISALPFLLKLVRLDYLIITKVLIISNVSMLLLIVILHGIRILIIKKIP